MYMYSVKYLIGLCCNLSCLFTNTMDCLDYCEKTFVIFSSSSVALIQHCTLPLHPKEGSQSVKIIC